MTNPISRMIGEKKQWRQYKARVAALPQPHRAAAEAVEHYLMRVGAVFVSDAQGLMQMFDDLAELFEQSAADGTPVRDIVGDDPVAFVEDFITNYPSGRWLTKERERLTEAITKAGT
ncbi:DUF1048 domain-containing protein [Aeromicrobium sp. HA]|uniref:DUF1048 domain-containing protein n=1 Tax=Aeromicrobium sp. HA TaxID=3009077 RepID=UPI0022AFAA05|nr:DUF1048 domain-containing protein [Aeromicrobium sp. HA]